MFFFFFFQAEDGIRDRDVTGVQTCALPISKGLADGEVKGEDETLIEIGRRMVNRKDPLQIVTEVTLLGMTEVNKDVLDADKRGTLKGTAWQKMSIYTRRKHQKKMLI